MKKLFPLVLLLVMGYFGIAQNSIANSGFEEWVGDTMPASWTTAMNGDIHISFSGIPINIPISVNFGTRSTDAHEGMYAVKLQAKNITFMGYGQAVPGMMLLGTPRKIDASYDLNNTDNLDTSMETLYSLIASGAPCSLTPDSLVLWVKYLPVNDTMSVISFTKKNGVIVSQADYSSSEEKNEYTRLSIPFDLPRTECDTICIAIMASAMAIDMFTELYVDDISLKYLDNNGVSDRTPRPSIQVYPSPATENVFLNPAGQDVYDYYLLNLAGEVVTEGLQVKGKQSLSVGALSPGIYMLCIRLENQTITRKVVVL